jgi:hypothetical protein
VRASRERALRLAQRPQQVAAHHGVKAGRRERRRDGVAVHEYGRVGHVRALLAGEVQHSFGEVDSDDAIPELREQQRHLPGPGRDIKYVRGRLGEYRAPDSGPRIPCRARVQEAELVLVVDSRALVPVARDALLRLQCHQRTASRM